jgi:hypothetical protein
MRMSKLATQAQVLKMDGAGNLDSCESTASHPNCDLVL